MKNRMNTQSSDTPLHNDRLVRFTDPSFIEEVARILKVSEEAYLSARSELAQTHQDTRPFTLLSMANETESI